MVPGSHFGVAGWKARSGFSCQVPANVDIQTVVTTQVNGFLLSTWETCIPSPASTAVLGIWGKRQQTGDPVLSVSLCPFHSFSAQVSNKLKTLKVYFHFICICDTEKELLSADSLPKFLR